MGVAMAETASTKNRKITLGLKIARLEHHLRELEQQQVLSSAYYNQDIEPTKEQLEIEFQLHQLNQLLRYRNN